jgi:hypothetical protein
VTKNGVETDIDCGGGVCTKCGNGKVCSLASDCTSGVCKSGVCQVPTCTDVTKNGAETDIDCGGGTCSKCVIGKTCSVGTDCTTSYCQGGVCAAATSCKALLAAQPGLPTGPYLLDPDGPGGVAAFTAYCDMTPADGGWTLVMKAINTNFTYDDLVWTTNNTLNDGDFDFATSGAKAKYSAFNTVAFDKIRSSYTTDFSKNEVYQPAKSYTSALALFGGPGIQISAAIPAPLDPYWDGIVVADAKNSFCNSYLVVGINMRDFLGTGFLPGGGLCDWNGGARWGQRVDAFQQNTGNHAGQGWGAYSTITGQWPTPFEMTQLLWVR